MPGLFVNDSACSVRSALLLQIAVGVFAEKEREVSNAAEVVMRPLMLCVNEAFTSSLKGSSLKDNRLLLWLFLLIGWLILIRYFVVSRILEWTSVKRINVLLWGLMICFKKHNILKTVVLHCDTSFFFFGGCFVYLNHSMGLNFYFEIAVNSLFWNILMYSLVLA